jgi:hypothetical protein
MLKGVFAMRTLLLGFALLVLTTAVEAADGGGTTTDQQVLCGVRADKTDYKVGEAVGITFIVENRGKEAATLHFPSAQQHDVWVVKDGREVWRWSRGRAFAQMLTSLTIPAGGRKTFRVTWAQTDQKGDQVGPGAYSIFAQLTTAQPRPTPVKDTVTIAVAPPVVKPTTVDAIVKNLDTAKGTLVQLQGTYLGFQPNPDSSPCRPGPPVTRSDWAFQDITGCIYVTGLYRLDPVRDVGTLIFVAGYVRVTDKGQPYIQATSMGASGEMQNAR